MTWHVETAIACALLGLLAGQVVPTLIARIPEPEPEPDHDDEVHNRDDEAGESRDSADGGRRSDLDKLDHPEARLDHRETELGTPGTQLDQPEDEEPKELYVDIARHRGLRWKCSIATAVVAGLLGGVVGWTPALSFLLYLAVVGVALAVVDWHTRLLPTKVIAPSYFAVAALVAGSAWVEQDLDALITAGLGWLVAGGSFFVLWFIYPRGMGYGDVRLSGVLGIALGYLGWAELLTGIYAGFVVGGLGGLLLSLLRVVDRKAYPFGPFMLVGAVLGVLLGPAVAAWYG